MPVVCVRLSDEAVTALEAQAARKGVDRSSWLRDVVLGRLGMAKETDAVEAILPPPPQMVEPLHPGDRLAVSTPRDPSLPTGAIRP